MFYASQLHCWNRSEQAVFLPFSAIQEKTVEVLALPLKK